MQLEHRHRCKMVEAAMSDEAEAAAQRATAKSQRDGGVLLCSAGMLAIARAHVFVNVFAGMRI